MVPVLRGETMSDGCGDGDPSLNGIFIDIDEEDPFNSIQLLVTEDTGGFIAGELEAEPGRYELRRVDDAN